MQADDRNQTKQGRLNGERSPLLRVLVKGRTAEDVGRKRWGISPIMQPNLGRSNSSRRRTDSGLVAFVRRALVWKDGFPSIPDCVPTVEEARNRKSRRGVDDVPSRRIETPVWWFRQMNGQKK